MLKDFDLTGRRVLITGAGRGIGKGIALAMAEAGADIAITSLGGATAEAAAAEVRNLGRKGFGWGADATKVAPMEEVRDKAFAALGGIDILINCLGDSIQGSIAAMPGAAGHVVSEADWHAVIDINLTQAYVGCHVFGPHLLEKRAPANVINVSGALAFRPSANTVAYAAAKAGLTRFTDSLALEWAPFGVRVNAIAPGTFPDAERLTPAEWQRREAEAPKTIPLGRVGRTREVGLLAVYLASDAASYVTGQTFIIDGGRTLL